MEATIKKIISLPGIPSASGIEIQDDRIFIIGDDSNYLFVLDHDFNTLEKVKLYNASEFNEDGRIKKPFKADLEALSFLKYNGKEYLLAIGSGSTELRERAFLIETRPFAIREYALATLYKTFRQDQNITTSSIINIEGLTTYKNYSYFLQRGNIAGKNTIIWLDTRELLDFMIQPDLAFLSYQTASFDLPKINNIPSGFSGASMVPETSTLLFTATVEDTPDEIADGEVFGSFIGAIDLDNIHAGVQATVKVKNETGFYSEKLESIVVVSKNGNILQALAVVDNDRPVSELLMIEIKI